VLVLLYGSMLFLWCYNAVDYQWQGVGLLCVSFVFYVLVLVGKTKTIS